MAAVTRARIPVWALSFVSGTVGLVGYDACFTRRRSRVRTSDCVFHISGRVAQMVEHGSNKPRVVGSSPTVTRFYTFESTPDILTASSLTLRPEAYIEKGDHFHGIGPIV